MAELTMSEASALYKSVALFQLRDEPEDKEHALSHYRTMYGELLDSMETRDLDEGEIETLIHSARDIYAKEFFTKDPSFKEVWEGVILEITQIQDEVTASREEGKKIGGNFLERLMEDRGKDKDTSDSLSL